MPRLNPFFFDLSSSYLFANIEKKIEALPPLKRPLINLGIGDVSQPLFPSVIQALERGVQEMGSPLTFKGYGPSEGYLFLRKKIAEQDYAPLSISPEEIFISDGANSDLANLQELFAKDNQIAIPDPTYPVYLDTNVIAGRAGAKDENGVYSKVTPIRLTESNDFQGEPPPFPVDLIYLCSPSNPTGVAMTKESLTRWVEYAHRWKSLIFFDGAYEAFVQSPEVPHSIYEIKGAKEVAIEVRSFSKSAGFTALRCGYSVIPKELQVENNSLRDLWKRRTDAKSNGVSYPIQRAAEALYTPQGIEEKKAFLASFPMKTKKLKQTLHAIGWSAYGGDDAPYVWAKPPTLMSSWEATESLLQNAQIVALPGSGFGPSGEGFVRFSAFPQQKTLEEAIDRLKEELCPLLS